MAIHPNQDGQHGHTHNASNSSFSDLESWASAAIQSLALSETSVASIPIAPPIEVVLDEPALHGTSTAPAANANVLQSQNVASAPMRSANAGRVSTGSFVHARQALRHDGPTRRETLQKGREGSRRRQRWENDRLLSNPYAQPPLPQDWQVCPTYPVRAVPYYLASLWDTEFAARSAARKSRAKKHANSKSKSAASAGNNDAAGTCTGTVPKELRETLKRRRGAKGLLQDIENDVRGFVSAWEAHQQRSRTRSGTGISSTSSDGGVLVEAPLDPDPNSEEPDSDSEMVIIGADGHMTDVPPSPTLRRMDTELSMEEVQEELQRYKLVFDSLADDKGASFGRWLVHSIASYYGLNTWSVTVGDPARREAYVGLRDEALGQGKKMRAGRSSGNEGAMQITLPRPLWGQV